MVSKLPPHRPDFLDGGGGMGALVRAHDWTRTDLGPISDWPQSLRTALSIILNSKFPTYMVWGPGMLSFYNDAYRPLLGDKPEALGRPFSEVWPEVWSTVGPIAERAMAGEASFFDNLPLTLERHGHAEKTWWSFSYSPVRDESGGVAGVLCTVYETTKKVQAHATVEAEKELLRSIFVQSAAGISQCDTTGRFLLANQRFCEIVGYSESELLGLQMQDITHPEDLVVNLPLFRRAVHDREPFMLEQRYVRKDGSDIWVENSVAPVLDGAGAVVAVVAVTIDATQRKQAEVGVQRLAAILESSDDAILATDLEGIITSWNGAAEKLYGYRAEDVIGQPVAILLADDRKDEGKAILERIGKGERIEHYETVRRRKNSTLVEISLTVSPIRNAQGRVIGASKSARDITERREAERMRDILLHELTHRVKNTLAVVQAIAGQTFRNSENMEAREIFGARLRALSKAHDLLTRENWNGAELSDLIAEVLAPFPRNRFEISGPRVRLTAKVAMAFTLALHELATNASKYGALSAPAGQVTLTWTIRQGEPPHLDFLWQERDGPPVSPPVHTGLGSRLIERSLAVELSAQVKVTYDPAGLKCEVDAPLTNGTEERLREIKQLQDS